MTKEKVFDYIKTFIQEKGYSPTFDEICEGVGIRSKATVAYNLNWLKAEGRVDWQYKKTRTLIITERGKDGIINGRNSDHGDGTA